MQLSTPSCLLQEVLDRIDLHDVDPTVLIQKPLQGAGILVLGRVKRGRSSFFVPAAARSSFFVPQ